MGLSLLRDVPGVAAIVGAGEGIADVTEQAERLDFVDRVDVGGAGVWHDEHVALIDGLETPDARPVKAGAVRKEVLVDLVWGNPDVLQGARNVGELEIDDLNSLIMYKFYDFFWRHLSTPCYYLCPHRLSAGQGLGLTVVRTPRK